MRALRLQENHTLGSQFFLCRAARRAESPVTILYSVPQLGHLNGIGSDLLITVSIPALGPAYMQSPAPPDIAGGGSGVVEAPSGTGLRVCSQPIASDGILNAQSRR
jgi:hypothetical protein